MNAGKPNALSADWRGVQPSGRRAVSEDEDRETFIRSVRGLGNEALARQLCDKRWPVFGGRWWTLPNDYRAPFLAELIRWMNLVNVEGQRRKGERPEQPHRDGSGGAPVDASGQAPLDVPRQGATPAQRRKQAADARRIERELLGPGGPGFRGTEWVNE